MVLPKRIFSVQVLALGLAALLTMILAIVAIADPPARVARINYLQGPVSLQRGDLDEWDPAVINYPLVANDSLWTDNPARAELHIGSTAIRLSDQTSISFLNLNDQVVQIKLAQGTLDLNLNRLGNDETYEIDTPDGSVSLLRAGEYRVDVDADGNATFITRYGQAEVTTSNAAFAVAAGQQAFVANTADATYQISAATPRDGFEQWAEGRAQRELQAVSARYVSREMTGYEDLDAYGSWTVLPGYGNAWMPATVAAGWTPYSTGDWLWAEPYGWTWVDTAPWGFAPFHYGRWAFVSQQWYWVPGPLGPHPVFAPALVSFVGGNDWGLSLGFGNAIGWFPLGPYEFYQPAYFVSERYVRGLNPVFGTNVYVTDRFVNRAVPGAVTVVSREVFTSGRLVTTERINVEPRLLTVAPLLGATAPIAPVRASLLARADHAGLVARPPDGLRERIVQTKLAPAPGAAPFAARQSALMANPGKPFGESAPGRIRGEESYRQDRAERSASSVERAPEEHFRVSPPIRPNDQPGFRQEHAQPARRPPERGNGFAARHNH